MRETAANDTGLGPDYQPLCGSSKTRLTRTPSPGRYWQSGKSKQLQPILGDVPLMPEGKVSHHVRHGNGHLEQEERGLPTMTADRGRACC